MAITNFNFPFDPLWTVLNDRKVHCNKCPMSLPMTIKSIATVQLRMCTLAFGCPFAIECLHKERLFLFCVVVQKKW